MLFQEREKLLQRQEQTQNLKHLHQELEMMSRRNESVQLKLSSADRENNILQLNIKQRDIEIARLQTAVGYSFCCLNIVLKLMFLCCNSYMSLALFYVFQLLTECFNNEYMNANSFC